MYSRELKITDIEELNDLAEWIITTYKFECYKFDRDGNMLTDLLKCDEDRDNVLRSKDVEEETYYFGFSENPELKEISFSEALNMSLDEIKEKYLKEHLPKLRAMLRKDSLYQGVRPSADIPDYYLDNLLALRWKENLKLWTRQWEFKKEFLSE